MFINRLIRLFAFLMFAGFFAIILWKVPRLDLAAVIGLGTLAVLYDLFETERRDRRAKRTRSATS